MLTAERARELLDYNPETGWLTWKVSHSKRVKAGMRAGTREARMPGYFLRRICIDNRAYYEHRVIWLIVTGEWPREQIDHVNHDATDNRLTNLRAVTHGENAKNQKLHSNNSTGITGTYWASRESMFAAEIIVDKRKIRLGYFRTLADAAAARKAAETEHGFHENHGLK